MYYLMLGWKPSMDHKSLIPGIELVCADSVSDAVSVLKGRGYQYPKFIDSFTKQVNGMISYNNCKTMLKVIKSDLIREVKS